MMHLIVSTPNMQVDRYPGDCLGPSYHEFSIVRNPLKIEGPMTTLPEAPGLGVEVDWDLVERHRIDRA
jgi:L-alanine-DL-glutamate epimerase-like enolase superfamily enzyme